MSHGKEYKKGIYLVDEENTLAQVEFGILDSVDSFDLNKVLVCVLKNLGSRL